MSIMRVFSLLFCVLLFLSCQDEPDKIIQNIGVREIGNGIDMEDKGDGSIPDGLDFRQRLSEVQDDPNAQVQIIIDLKSQHENSFFYSNLFQSAIFYVFAEDKIYELNAEELDFLLNEVQSVDSNMAHLQQLPELLNVGVEKHQITWQEHDSILKSLITKNRVLVHSIKWRKTADMSAKLEEINALSSNFRYRGNLYTMQ